MRILGIDYGTVRAGLAVSDQGGIIAQPKGFVQGRDLTEMAASIIRQCRELQIEKIVIGLPRHLDGREGESAEKARQLGSLLEKKISLPVVFWEERWSTVAAEKALLEGNVSRQKRKTKIDAVAAAIILQNYLDHQQNNLNQQIT